MAWSWEISKDCLFGGVAINASRTVKRSACSSGEKNTNKLRIFVVALLLVGCSESAPPPEADQVNNGAESIQLECSGEILAGVRVVHVRAFMFDWAPNPIILNAGEPVKLIVSSVDTLHGIVIPELGINEKLPPGQPVEIEFTVPRAGTYDFFCSVVCGWGHNSMTGYLLVLGKDELERSNLESGNVEQDLRKPEIRSTPIRQLVKQYRFEDLQSQMDWPKGSRSFAAGKNLFVEMNCSKCHRIDAAVIQVGPSLARENLKLSRRELLREILEPSRKIDERFRQWTFISGGKMALGVILEESDEYYLVDESPGEAGLPTKIFKVDLDQMPQSSDLSTMPSSLLNTMEIEEIQDLIAFVHAKGDPQHAWFDQQPMLNIPQEFGQKESEEPR